MSIRHRIVAPLAVVGALALAAPAAQADTGTRATTQSAFQEGAAAAAAGWHAGAVAAAGGFQAGLDAALAGWQAGLTAILGA